MTLLLATFTIGIGIGSLLCERMSAKHVELGLVPFGSIGLTCSASISALQRCRCRPARSPGGRGVAGAWQHLAHPLRPVHDRPLRRLLHRAALRAGAATQRPGAACPHHRCQQHHERTVHGRRSAAAAGLLGAGLSIPVLFAVAAVCNAAVALFIYGLVPEFLLRFLAWLLIHSFYKLKKRGIEHIPHEGAALVVCNHVSFVDPVILMAISPRPIRFVMDHRIFKTPIISFIFRHSRAIPIAPAKEDPDMMEQAFAEVAKALDAGELVGIFPRGESPIPASSILSVRGQRAFSNATRCRSSRWRCRGCGAASSPGRTVQR